VRALSAEVEPARWWRIGGGSKSFQGDVGADAFDVQRVISYRNSFLPQIHGAIRADARGSRVSVEMSVSPSVLVFLLVWVGIALQLFFSATGWFESHVAPVLLLAFVWLMTMGAFKPEAIKAERELARILRATIWQPSTPKTVE